MCGHVFDAIPAWIQKDSPATKDLWAPDISFYRGEYRLYYAYSLFGKNTSGIALATNKTLDVKSPKYKWVDKGLILQSTSSDDYNAIDPNFIANKHGRSWLAFGSFWSGIKLRELAPDGTVSVRHKTLYSLAAREKPADSAPAKPGLPAAWQAVEAPFIVHRRGYYYLFVSWDLCCRGSQSTYRAMAGRAKKITGPYLDESGKDMLQGGGTEVLQANEAWRGPGGESVWLGSPHDLIVYHAYDATSGKPALRISTLDWPNGWPHASLSTSGGPAPH